MILFFILIFVSFILFLFFTFVFGEHFELLIVYIFFPLIVSIFVSGSVVCGADTVDVISSQEEIYSLQDSISTTSNGAFTIYHSNEDNKYYYYIFDDEINGLKYASISAKDVILKFDDNARLVKYKTRTKSENLRRWFFDLNVKEYTVLYLPKESIIDTINVNLQ